MVSLDYTYFTFTRSCMLCIGLCRRLGWELEKCRQSARLFLQSSELRLPHPLRRVSSPLLWFRGGYTLTAGEGVGGSQFRRGAGTDTMVLLSTYLYTTLTAGEGVGRSQFRRGAGTDTMVLLSTYLHMHFVFTGMGEGHYTQTI